ncbi:MAG: ArsA family ATPase [Deltaproteobacteria bacterium]|nr:MAG: ArsA family ATPase [Deltaproteobacteria bacterium]
MRPLAQVLEGRKVICCVGSGGVGKTTVAAALALSAAIEGKRALVLTIDPARRLANSLGLKELGNQETRIAPELFAQAGLHPRGEMWAMMLDLKLTWDELVERQARSPEQARAILTNKLYQTLSTAMAGSLEYMAMEKVYEVHTARRFDVVVLDTPPTTNALDFLHASDRILDVLDNDAMRIILGPMLRAGKLWFKLLAAPSAMVLRTLARFTGTDFLRDLADFMIAFEGMYEGFKERAARVKALLTSPEAGFVLVTAPNPLTIQEALFFHQALREDRIATAAVVVNRVQRDPRRHGGPDNVAAMREALMLAQIKDSGDLAERLCTTLTEQSMLADLERREVERLSRTLSGVPLLIVPRLRKDVHDLSGLWQIDQFLGGQ